MQEILPLVLNGGDLTPLHTTPNWDRVPWLEEKRLALVVDQLPNPRAMVTHFPYQLMPPSFLTSKAKVSVWTLSERFTAVLTFQQTACFVFTPTCRTADKTLNRFFCVPLFCSHLEWEQKWGTPFALFCLSGSQTRCCLSFIYATGDLCHEEPQGCHCVFILLPPNGSIPWRSRDIWRVCGQILEWQRSDPSPYIVHFLIKTYKSPFN